MSPSPGENKFLKRLAAALRFLPFSQGIWQQFCITWIAERNDTYRLPTFRYPKALSRHVRVKPAHLMRRKSQGRGLKDKVGCGLSEIVEAVPVWLAIFVESRVRKREQERRRIGCPGAVGFHKDSGERFVAFRIIACRHEISPRLFIPR